MNYSRGVKRADIEDIGVYSLLTNTFCLVHTATSERIFSNFESELNDIIPLIHTSVMNCASIGCMAVGNSRGLLIPNEATDQELLHLVNSLPTTVEVKRLDERLRSLGNNVVCNDKVAIVNPDLDRMSIELIEQVLGVEVFPHKIAGESVVGSFLALNNKGALAHPRTSVSELDELNSLLGVPVCAGSVNRGKALVGKGCVVNDYAAFAGKNTTANEVSIIENIFQLSLNQGALGYTDTMRSAIIENMY